MKRFKLVDQIIFMPLYELVKDNYIFSLGALIYNSFNNVKKNLKMGILNSRNSLRVQRLSFLEKS